MSSAQKVMDKLADGQADDGVVIPRGQPVYGGNTK